MWRFVVMAATVALVLPSVSAATPRAAFSGTLPATIVTLGGNCCVTVAGLSGVTTVRKLGKVTYSGYLTFGCQTFYPDDRCCLQDLSLSLHAANGREATATGAASWMAPNAPTIFTWTAEGDFVGSGTYVVSFDTSANVEVGQTFTLTMAGTLSRV